MMAKKAAEKAKKEAIEKRAQEEEYKKMISRLTKACDQVQN